MTILTQEEELDALRWEKPLLLVQFGTESCAPCKAIRQRIDDWTEEHPSVGALYISIEDFPRLAAQLGVYSAPAVFLYVEGNLTARESGYFSLNAVLAQGERYLGMLS